MAFTDRIPYQAQIDRPKLTLPGGKKLAVWVILNVEEWRIENAMPRTVLSPPMGQPLLPDVPNWSWHEYGMRAGFWRQFKALTERKIPVTLALNANVCSTYPRVAGAALEAGFEWLGNFSRKVQIAPSHHVYRCQGEDRRLQHARKTCGVVTDVGGKLAIQPRPKCCEKSHRGSRNGLKARTKAAMPIDNLLPGLLAQ